PAGWPVIGGGAGGTWEGGLPPRAAPAYLGIEWLPPFPFAAPPSKGANGAPRDQPPPSLSPSPPPRGLRPQEKAQIRTQGHGSGYPETRANLLGNASYASSEQP